MPVTAEDIRNFRQQRVRIDNIDYSANNTKNVKLPIEAAIDHLECVLKFDWSSSSGILKSAKGLGLIKWLVLRVGGTSEVIRIPGKALQYLHQWYYREAPYANDPGVTSTGNAVYHFTIPINASVAELDGVGNLSLLDLSNTSGQWEIVWGDESDIWSSGTNSVSNVEFRTNVIQSFSLKAGIPGSIGYNGYLLHMLTTDEQSITATNADMKVDLTENHIFRRIMIMCDTDDTFTDSILNSLTIKAGEATFQELKREDMQYENKSRYRFSQLQTGVYVADMMTPGQWQQMLSYLSSQRFRLSFNVSKPGTGTAHRMMVMYDRFIRP